MFLGISSQKIESCRKNFKSGHDGQSSYGSLLSSVARQKKNKTSLFENIKPLRYITPSSKKS